MTNRTVFTILVILLAAVPLLAACGDGDETPTASPTTELTGEPTAEPTTGDGEGDLNEPPANPYLANSAWSMCHRNSYCQGSSPLPGLMEPPVGTEEDFLLGRVATITANFSSPYPDGKRVIWASNYGQVVKIDPEGDKLTYIDRIQSQELTYFPDALAENLQAQSCREVADFLVPLLPDEDKDLREGEAIGGASGIYGVLSSDMNFYQPLVTTIVAWGDAEEGNRFSPIEKKRTFEIPAEKLSREWDKIMGLSMTYDGYLTFSTNYSLVGVVSRDFTEAHYIQLPTDEYSYNSIATDENGGIYVVTHKAMYRIQWDEEKLSYDESDGGWRAEYGSGQLSDVAEVQSKGGSGSTPSLMGVGDQDKFVVITDGEKLMNIILFWRDEIPEDWQQLPGTNNRRIAVQVPITFGDPDREDSFSDQSVLVRSYGAFVVNNKLGIYEDMTLLNTLLSGEPDRQPYGCEKFEWDPDTRTLNSVWVNQEVSFPNAIPTMSEEANLIYGIGARNGIWTVEALYWDTGESAWYYEVGDRARHNSAFAAILVGPESDMYYGTYFGMIRIHP